MSRIVIVGGGITGLSTAYYLHKAAKAAGQTPEIIVVERSERLGGKIRTEHAQGLTIEVGPDSFLARKPWMAELCQELGLPVTGQNPAVRKTYIVRKGKLVPLPKGTQIIIPTQIGPFLRSPLLSWRGKLRALAEVFVPRRQGTGDESMGSFVTRRFGPELLDRLAAPMLAGIYAGDTHGMSLQATFPQFLTLEEKYGSLIRGARKGLRPQGSTGSAFLTVTGGLETVIPALVAAMPGVTYEFQATVTGISRDAAGWTVQLDGDRSLAADHVVITTPGYEMARLVEPVVPVAAQALAEVPHNSAVIVALAFRPEDVQVALDATGFLVPKGEALDITASTWVTAKWPHTTDGKLVLIRGYLGRAGGRDWTKVHEVAAVLTVRGNLRETMGITAEPVLARVFPWPKGLPQYRMQHLERMGAARNEAAAVPGLHLAGAVFRGAGLPDCVREGKEAAAQIAAQCGWNAVG